MIFKRIYEELGPCDIILADIDTDISDNKCSQL